MKLQRHPSSQCHTHRYLNAERFTSYNTLVAVLDLTSRVLYITEKKYSKTTSRQITWYKKEIKYSMDKFILVPDWSLVFIRSSVAYGYDLRPIDKLLLEGDESTLLKYVNGELDLPRR
jgi:hypothetical protein